MGIICEINVPRPLNEEFKPGDVLSGVIRYVTDKEIEVSCVNVHLKGTGNTVITYRNRRKDPKYFCKEEYVNICESIQGSGKLIVGERYEKRFEFTLPHNIPPSFEYRSTDLDYNIISNISYYLKIKFKRPEVFKTDKIFKKEITIGAFLNPTLSKEPVTYQSQYKLVSCNGRNNIIDLKVKVENSLVKPNGKLKYHHEIFNNTCGHIESVKACLVERYTFRARGQEKIVTHKEIEWTDIQQSNPSPIERSDTQITYQEIHVPCDKYNIQYSTMIARDYYVKLRIMLPVFGIHRTFKFPVEVGDEFEVRTENLECRSVESNPPDYDPPPSYWEVMGENPREISDDED